MPSPHQIASNSPRAKKFRFLENRKEVFQRRLQATQAWQDDKWHEELSLEQDTNETSIYLIINQYIQ